jgi:hypothetical protein
MSVRQVDLAGDFRILKGIHYANANFATEMAAIATALLTETARHDRTIDAPSSAVLKIGEPNGSTFTRLTNDAILLVNLGLAGGLKPSQILGAIDDAASILYKPGNIDIPYASANASPPVVGTVVTVTNGNWTGTPTGYTYQWKRDGSTNLGTAASYTLVSADIGSHAITCVVTATNATGSTAAPASNAIAT